MMNILNIEPIKQFIIKRASINLIINLLLNFGVQYWGLHNFEQISFSSGEQSILRVFLPLAFFLPLFVTMDSVKRFYDKTCQKNVPYSVPKKYKTLKFRLILGLKNAGWSLLVFSIILVSVFLLSPKNMMFNSVLVMVVLTSMAGAMAVIFTISPVVQILRATRKLNSIH
ncbi:hypothetical protein LVD15_15605 [Fulvivirga maritima]|uniref:hypothetical protein n=1 Tax=Fulvivirga maritima TaxID=2904247 RepID=UPI001F44578A|nr:hypothetical protein [Fulvivirga maritima]UII24736.1 hypothetical protein LVD15_15605 [Fulvivirga maritima]